MQLSCEGNICATETSLHKKHPSCHFPGLCSCRIAYRYTLIVTALTRRRDLKHRPIDNKAVHTYQDHNLLLAMPFVAPLINISIYETCLVICYITTLDWTPSTSSSVVLTSTFFWGLELLPPNDVEVALHALYAHFTHNV